MKLNEVAGQQKVKQHLLQIVNENKIGHAYLFLEKEGAGALALAIAFVQYIHCTNKLKNHLIDSCGECASCLKMQKIQHPDVHYTFPIIKDPNKNEPISTGFIKEWQQFVKNHLYSNVFDWLQIISGEQNKQGNIFSEECNVMIQKLYRNSFESEYKIQIIWMAEYLKNEGNKLLKLIEEPPAKTIIILIAENKNLLLPTICSRLQEIQLERLSDLEIKEYLIQQQFPTEKINSVVALSNGNIREAILLINEEFEENLLYFKQMLNAIFLSKTQLYIEWAEDISKKGREFIKQYFLYVLKNFQLCYPYYFNHSTSSNNQNDSSTHVEFLQKITIKIDIQQLFYLISLIEEYYYYIERNGNEVLTLHAMLIKANSIIVQHQQLSIH